MNSKRKRERKAPIFLLTTGKIGPESRIMNLEYKKITRSAKTTGGMVNGDYADDFMSFPRTRE